MPAGRFGSRAIIVMVDLLSYLARIISNPHFGRPSCRTHDAAGYFRGGNN